MSSSVLSAHAIPRTSEVPFFSSLHGRERRNLRGIDRRDLQAAVKHGKKEHGWPHPVTGEARWKYTWAGIVYITNASSTTEVTSYAEPLGIPRAKLTPDDLAEHAAAKEKLEQDPSLCTSHTVIVVDQSGSMRTSDVFDFKNRSQAVFGMLALDFVAKQRLSGEVSATDVVSVVLMHDYAEVAFEREPMGLALYNTFLDLHDNGTPKSHGNFLPALALAESLLKRQSHGGCALALLFLSDGKPSDQTEAYYSMGQCREKIIARQVTALSEMFGEQLSVSTLGFANRDQDFSVLEKMAKAAQDAGANGEFHRPELSSDGLGTAIARTASLLTATRTRLTTLALHGGQPRMLRRVEREAISGWWDFPPSRDDAEQTTGGGDSGWRLQTVNVERFRLSRFRKYKNTSPWIRQFFNSDQADCIAIRRKSLGEGAERMVFGLQEFDSRSWKFVGPKMVAKESRHEFTEEDDRIDFHRKFIETQLTAKRIANKFNMVVRERLSTQRFHRASVWKVTFVDCHVYVYGVQKPSDSGSKTSTRGVLAEKLLEGHYKKWNGNNGYVPGCASQPDAEQQARAKEMMEAIPEGEGEEDYDSDNTVSSTSDEDETRLIALVKSSYRGREITGQRGCDGGRQRGRCPSPVPMAAFNPTAECYLQAFSHFSYRYTKRSMLVCDLQGVLSVDARSREESCEGVFELTDPVIHYKSRSGRKQVYGRTDFGKKGMHKFFETHLCNDVCVLLGLSSRARS